MSARQKSRWKQVLKRWAIYPLLGGLHLFSWMPMRWISALAKGLGWLLFWIPNPMRKVAQANLRAVYPTLSSRQQRQRLKSVLQHNAQSILELGPMWYWPQSKLVGVIREVHGQDYLQQAYARGKGVLLLGPHIGNWELAGIYAAIHYPTTIMYRPPNLPGLDPVMRHARTRFGSSLVATDLRGLRQLIQALHANQVSALLPDQDAGKNGVHAPFMGIPARTMTLVSKLLQKTEAECLMLIAVRHPQGGFVVHLLPTDRAALASPDSVEAACALNQAVEHCIALAPGQYLWTYRRFRGLPVGTKSVY
ncbi:MAG: lysophospholipid acyltransferase family protein [Thiotrichales bacterium]|nr:lysophospholipid acyltransferase family protein [Thiotrichales bacterium]